MATTKKGQKRSFLQVLNIFHSVPRSITTRTFSLWTCFFSIAFSDSVRGPTFLDVRDTIGISTQEMSYTYMVAAIGGLIGCFTAGLLLDRFSNSFRYFVLLLCGTMVALFVGTVPFAPNLHFLLANSLGFGFFNGCFHTCANALFLQIWKGYNSSSALYAMHFFYGLGSLLSPLAAKPFLSHIVDGPLEESDMGIAEVLMADNSTANDIMQVNQQQNSQMTIKSLYPLLGLQTCLLFLPLIYFAIKERRFEAENIKIIKEAKSSEESAALNSKQTTLVMVLMFLIYFCFAGLEGSFRNFISTYAVSIGNSRQVGSEITALFYLSFTIVRGLAVIGGMLLSPAFMMWASQGVCLGGTALLTLWGAESFTALQIGVVLIGAGTAYLFPTGVLWLKDILTLDTRKTAVLTVGMNISIQTYTFLIGRFIDSSPSAMMQIMVVTALTQIILFFNVAMLVKYFRCRNSVTISRL